VHENIKTKTPNGTNTLKNSPMSLFPDQPTLRVSDNAKYSKTK